MVFLLGGGLDTVLTFDPKVKKEVDPDYDIPYQPNEIATTPHLPLGPVAKPLVPHAAKLAIVHGVRTGTAAHFAGVSQVLRMRLGVKAYSREPSFLELLGTRRGAQPAAVVQIAGGAWPTLMSPGHLAIDTINEVAKLSSEDRAVAARAVRRQAQHVASRVDSSAADHLRSVADLLDRMQSVPKFEAKEWSKDEKTQAIGVGMQQTLWLIQNDLTLSVQWFEHLWDSHKNNLSWQTSVGQAFFPMLARFIAELDKISNDRGRLSDQVRVIVGSELGRFPKLNPTHGKHHFPEMDYMFVGPGFPPGRYGQTGRLKAAEPVSLQSGKPDKAGTIVTLEDVGGSLLAASGIDPTVYGFRGRSLRFLPS